MTRRPVVVASVVAAIVAGVSVAAAWAQSAATTVKVTEKEFVVAPKPKKAAAGRITFTVHNSGKLKHEFLVLKTNRAPGKLPTNGTKASEKGKVGEIANVPPGATKKLALKLKAGKYVLLCNLPGHYKAGQYAGFSVG